MPTTLEDVKQQFAQFVKDLQNQVTAQMKRLDPQLEVMNDQWERLDGHGEPGGGGLTRYHRGQLFEAAGVNTSLVFGAIDPQFAKTLAGTGDTLWATGVSLIIHPRSPKIPTVHANFRLIHQGDKYWFGGGADLTPFYPHVEDFNFFHQHWKQVCAPFQCYERMKKECDQYFTNHHRQEGARGIGGIFFDHYCTSSLEADWNMVTTLAKGFCDSYFPIVEKRTNEAWTSQDEEFQLHRRGRYVEFNLLHDRGTLFGLKTKGRTESILISLPPRCQFSYNYHPAPNTPQAEMMQYYLPRAW